MGERLRGGAGEGKAGGREPQARQSPALTVRAVALGLVVLLAFIVVTPTMRAYLKQRGQYQQVEAQLAATAENVELLESELARWDDPSFVVAQARERLNLVLPGEVPYRVIDPQTVLGAEAASEGIAGLTAAEDTSPAVPWYLTLWNSVLEAGEGPAQGAGTPTGAGGQ